MNTAFIILGLVAVPFVGVVIVKSITTDETIISAHYEMLACEDCNHLTVEKSKNEELVGKTVIPVSSTIEIEKLIDGVVLTKEPLCLRGKPYKFNWSFLGIEPGGVRFEVLGSEIADVCTNL